MPDELAMLRALGAGVEPASVEIEEVVRRRLLRLMAARPARRRRWLGVAFAALVALGALAAAALLRGGDEGPVRLVDRAYAAISPRSGIMHFVAQYGSRANARYEETWVDLAAPAHRRTVQSSDGHVTRQVVSTRPAQGRAKRTASSGPVPPAPEYPTTAVEAGNDPVLVFRKLLHVGTVLSQTAITYDGRPAYRLVIRYTPPYKLADDVWKGERVVYTVDRRTYLPLEFRWRGDRVMGGGVSVTRYPVFEMLPSTPQTRALLRPVAHPRPYP